MNIILKNEASGIKFSKKLQIENVDLLLYTTFLRNIYSAMKYEPIFLRKDYSYIETQ